MSTIQTQANEGKIVQCIGAVIDIQFPRENMPHIYDALTLVDEATGSFAEKGLTFEVEQQLGDGVVRTIAMGSSDGLRRGMRVKNTGTEIGAPVFFTLMPRPRHARSRDGRARPPHRRARPGQRRRAP